MKTYISIVALFNILGFIVYFIYKKIKTNRVSIPTIYIETEEEEEKYLSEYKFSIHTKILESVEKAFDEDIENIELFQVVNNYRGFTFVVMVERGSWLDSLTKCLNYYKETEEYELCGRTQKLIDKINDV